MIEGQNCVFEFRLVVLHRYEQRTFLMKVVRTMYTISEGQPIAGILKHVYSRSMASVRSIETIHQLS